MNEEYANDDYQTTTIPFKTEYGVTIGTETKSSYKLCTKNCKYKNNWNELKQWLENHWQESQDIWFVKIIGKMQELENSNYENNK